MDIQASLGIHQLERLEKNFERRQEIWNTYNKAFENLPVITPAPEEKNTTHARHLYTILLDLEQIKISRDEIIEKLFKENIGSGVHYRSLHLHEYYRENYGFKHDDFPNSSYISDRTISLPLSPKLTNDDVQDVIQALKKVLNH